MVRNYYAKHGIPANAVTLDPPNSEAEPGPQPTLHFASPPSAPSTGPTLLYFHGGGYVNPIALGHPPFVWSCTHASGAKQLVLVEYSLAPEHRYPTQLVQAISALRYLLDTLKISPEDIIIGGDSAGGNVVGALLAHVVKPSPYSVPLDLGGKQLRAALFVCPWVMMDVGQKSYDTNGDKDFLDRKGAVAFKEAWAPNEEDVWANLCSAKDAAEVWDTVFSRDSQGVVKKAMVVAGTAEVLLDSCRVFARDYIRAETVVGGRGTDWSVVDEHPFVYVECKGEVHVQPALDSAMGYEGGAMKSAILRWLKSC